MNLAAQTPLERQNSFDLIRLFAALCVLISHQLGMAGYPELPLGPLGIALASTGLYIFFALSGYLVCHSWLRAPSLRRFLKARVLRIYPAFIVNIGFCVLFGAMLTTLSASDYWLSAQTWRFIVLNAPILTVPTQFTLPGVFVDARWPIVNGSIWTIKYELLCYLASAALMLATGTRKALARNALAIVLFLLITAYVYRISVYEPPQGEAFFGYYNAFNLLRFFMTFAAGALYALSEPLSDRARLVFLAVPAALIIFGPSPEFSRAGIILLLVLLMIEVGKTEIFFSSAYRRVGDLSYGTFLYGYPIQNLLMTRYYNGSNFSIVTAATVTIVLAIAWLSWRLVEKPFLRNK
ncbi:Peptidoglycan/LPS O-acetylase OafA/YrhL, contains acyltransferase and SGNH-hydrolase domains [Bosea sp. CRIB-10]|uniref:acyltransferase family protein n=1 Tax=Bosea sp. CRIB-10 TaxID=378404 RepID=UPI0008EBF40C|nr:acyltransferase [Bosea sp. CRIB-10]SFD64370.1 Peptidoglycan/LPS O-acetylase OafA/YrhL, contains acyltransferase and SGNH-hydrolase domains [Bosea sp. CRIB-10]